MEVFEVLVCADNTDLRANWARIIGHSLAELVGGFSAYSGQGGWVDGTVLMHEDHFRLQAYCQDMSAREVFNYLTDVLYQYKENTHQKCVLVVLNGEPYWLEVIPSYMDVDGVMVGEFSLPEPEEEDFEAV